MTGVSKRLTITELKHEPGAVAVIANYKDHTDPKYIGPGTWNVIHRRAYKARGRDLQLIFIEFMKDICAGFPCLVCKGHCMEYIKNHPLEDYLGVSVDINGNPEDIGLFIWTWKFHNAVNARLGKPIMSWTTAYNLYSNTESLVCSKSCLEAEGPPQKEAISTKIAPFKGASLPVQTQVQPFRLVPVHRNV